MKLNLGCGDLLFDDYCNVDQFNPAADVKADAKSLPFADNSIDEIYSSHLIEHFDFHEVFGVLKEWKRVLKPSGWLVIETPDFLASCRKFVETDEETRIQMYSHFFAKPWVAGEIHKFLYTPRQMAWLLDRIGFTNIHQRPALRYIGREDICMKFLCQKK